VIHSDGDALSRLIVDKFADVLSVQVHSLGQRLPQWLPCTNGLRRSTPSPVEPHVAQWEASA
jgi:hypothetical protein